MKSKYRQKQLFLRKARVANKKRESIKTQGEL